MLARAWKTFTESNGKRPLSIRWRTSYAGLTAVAVMLAFGAVTLTLTWAYVGPFAPPKLVKALGRNGFLCVPALGAAQCVLRRRALVERSIIAALSVVIAALVDIAQRVVPAAYRGSPDDLLLLDWGAWILSTIPLIRELGPVTLVFATLMLPFRFYFGPVDPPGEADDRWQPSLCWMVMAMTVFCVAGGMYGREFARAWPIMLPSVLAAIIPMLFILGGFAHRLAAAVGAALIFILVGTNGFLRHEWFQHLLVFGTIGAVAGAWALLLYLQGWRFAARPIRTYASGSAK